MKILCIGDIHGSDKWQRPVYHALEHFVDKIIFVGDYLDSFNILPIDILQNFKDIIDLKQKYPDKIVLLIGNHDYAYQFRLTGISGYNLKVQDAYNQMLRESWDLFDVAWGHGGDHIKRGYGDEKYTLVTHAGLTASYYKKFIDYEINDEDTTMHQVFKDEDMTKLKLHEILNHFKDNQRVLWKVGSERGGSGCGGILWADKRELISDRFVGIDQIVGHTGSKYIEQYKRDEDRLYFIDIADYDNCVGTLMLDL